MTVQYEQIKKDFLSGRLKGCKTYFEENNYLVEAAYCYIVLDRIDKARELFTRACTFDIRAHWGLVVLQLIEGRISISPTYFEVRNFLELDLNILILYCKGDYIQKIIRYADFLAYYNPECYKFIGRAFWANNLIPASKFYLQRAKDKFYNDPELHYLLGYIYFNNDNDIANCKKSLQTCLNILPEYAPAKALMKRI